MRKLTVLNISLFLLIFFGVLIFIMIAMAGLKSSAKVEEVNDFFSIPYKDFDFSGNLDEVKVNSLSIVRNGINVSYSFDNANFIGNAISIDLWVVNETGQEVKRKRDTFQINKDGEIEREVFIDLYGRGGNNNLYIALTDEPSNFIKTPLVLEDQKSITGNVVAIENQSSKMTIYLVFLLIVVVAIFFIAKERNKEDKKAK